MMMMMKCVFHCVAQHELFFTESKQLSQNILYCSGHLDGQNHCESLSSRRQV